MIDSKDRYLNRYWSFFICRSILKPLTKGVIVMDNEKLQPKHDEKSEFEARRKMLYAMHDSHFLSDAELKRDLKALKKVTINEKALIF